MKYSINFYTEKRKANNSIDVPILMFVSFRGMKLRYYTRLRCKPNQWIDEITESGERIQTVKKNVITPSGESYSTINNKLHDLKVLVDDIFKTCETLKIYPTIESLRNDIDKFLDKNKNQKELEGTGLFDRYQQYIDNSNVSYNSKKRKQTNLNILKEYCKDATFKSIDSKFLTDFRNTLLKKYAKNTVICELRLLRTFLKYALKSTWTNTNPFDNFKLDSEVYGEPIYITIQERDFIYNAEISKPYLERVRDIFIFQCMVGCRVGDLVKLKKDNIVEGFIQYVAGKTKDKKDRIARVPLTDKALNTLSKYDLPGGQLLPFITDQRYNEYIKELFRELGLNRIVTIKDPKTREGKQVKICDIATSHMARRVFVGSLYEKGIKNEVIASMSGHSEDSKSFSRYYSIGKEKQIDAIKTIE